MQSAERWAEAFVLACGEQFREGLDALKAIAAGIRDIPRYSGGSHSARQAEKMINMALDTAGYGGDRKSVTAAWRTVILLIRKNHFSLLADVAGEAEKIIAAKEGWARLVLEAAYPPDETFLEELAASLRKKLHAREVAFDIRIVPDILGGYRLYIGSERIDASLRGALKKMAEGLHAAGGISR